MATISVARALSKLKIIKDKLTKELTTIERYGATHSKTLSPASAEKDINKNHAAARKVVESAQQAFNDLCKEYRLIDNAILQSNIKTTIKSDILGEITIADALVIARTLYPYYSQYESLLRELTASAQKEADGYNKRNIKLDVAATNIDPRTLLSITAQPVLFFNKDEQTKVENIVATLSNELHYLINESNALTTIEIPD